MLAKRIIPCLDVKDGQVVKGVKFRDHKIVGDIVELAQYYSAMGADELVFYDITASSDQRTVDLDWITQIAKVINIPFCVAGGIRSVAMAEAVLCAGADKISINSPALENPGFIDELVTAVGSQCVVIGVDSHSTAAGYEVYQYTGDPEKTRTTTRDTASWLQEVQVRGAGEVVLNCMNQDGVRSGYDIQQLRTMRSLLQIPLIASGGAGEPQHFAEVFQQAQVDGALAASVFHNRLVLIPELKSFLQQQQIEMRV